MKGFANYAVGYDNIDVREATKRGIPISNIPGVLTDATAEMAWALLFAISRRVVASDTFMRSGQWKGWGPLQFIGGDITGATLGLVGAGRIGTAMAMKSRGFDMKVLYADTIRNEKLEQEFQRMKKTAYLINTSRGPILNEVELVQALKTDEIAGAALDVYEDEPLMAEGLKDLPNVIVTPHTASATKSSRGGMARIAATNLLAMLEGKRAPNCVNPEVYQ